MINNSQKKLSYNINIPFTINLDFLLQNTDKEKYYDSTYYKLSSIVVHVGSGNEYGHYFAIVNINDKWFKFDDDNISVSLYLLEGSRHVWH